MTYLRPWKWYNCCDLCNCKGVAYKLQTVRVSKLTSVDETADYISVIFFFNFFFIILTPGLHSSYLVLGLWPYTIIYSISQKQQHVLLKLFRVCRDICKCQIF